jgi:serine phosphatase RsbU (regulator of sigma subunit)
MPARLEVTDALGRRTIPIDKDTTVLGRRSESDVRLVGSDVSRDHAQIEIDKGQYVIHDRGSRYGTFVNGEQITERVLRHGDAIRLGRSGDAQVVFLVEEVIRQPTDRTSTAVGDLHQVAVLLEGLRALGAGRVLDEVLALVLDSAIEVSGAERGFIMLADAAGVLEFKLGRARGRVTLPGRSFETSRKIPEEVFTTGDARIVADLLDGDIGSHSGTIALGIRHVFCLPLRLVRYVERGDVPEEARRIGVLYLDSREKGALLSRDAAVALETLATEAAVAIENARLYREAVERAQLEQDLRIAAQIQQALLPPPRWVGGHFEAVGATLPCRSIGGDFFDYLELPTGEAVFALADVAGKGASAALLTAVVQGVLAAQAQVGGGPAETLGRVNQVLLRRAVQARFATMVYAVLAKDGRCVYANGGHNPPFLIGRSGVRRLETGGLILGLFPNATYEEETLQLEPGDTLVIFSDGVSEALSAVGDEFGDPRIQQCIEANCSCPAGDVLDALLKAVHDFTQGAVQSDDVTALVVRYGP